jgi:uncharacterized repeat protein (TIGR01451 family)
LVSATPSQGSYDSTTGVWNVGTVTPGVPVTLRLSATVIIPNALTNTASISRADQFDPDATNNTDSVTETPPSADLVLTKTVSQSQVFFGTNVTYTFTIRNLGPDTATNVVVTDPFPTGLVIVTAGPPSQGTYDPALGIWNVGTLVNGAVATLQVTARVVTIGTIVNTARADAAEFDPILSNDVSAATVIGLSPVLSKRSFFARRR